MNVALIFAGGTGQRMNTKSIPKQFLKVHGKPIIIYTIEQFEQHPDIDEIIVVCIESHIEYLLDLLKSFSIKKVKTVIPGGPTGIESIYLGLKKAKSIYPNDTIILVHDGVRPLIDLKTISSCLTCVLDHGNAVTVVPAIETVVADCRDGVVGTILNRSRCQMARAPQCFLLKDLYSCYQKALDEGKTEFIDSASIMQYYGYDLYTVNGKMENIKITTPMDYYIFRALIDAEDDSQFLGV